jgi:hypothetical protein
MKSSLLLMGMDIILKSFLGIDFVKKVRAFEKRFLLSSADLVAHKSWLGFQVYKLFGFAPFLLSLIKS